MDTTLFADFPLGLQIHIFIPEYPKLLRFILGAAVARTDGGSGPFGKNEPSPEGEVISRNVRDYLYAS